MKARVKATGKIVNVTHAHYITSDGIVRKKIYKDQFGNEYFDSELDFLQEREYVTDYWTRLEHQAAIAAMGGMCGNTQYDDYAWVDMAKFAIKAAHALVEMMKEERK